HQQVQEVLACEYGGINESFAELYARTGNGRWLHMAETIYDDKVLDPLAQRKDDLAYRHSNTNIPKLVGLARLYEVSGGAKYGVASAYFWKDVVERYTYVIGGNGDREYFQAPMTISTHITDQTCETCSSYNMLKLTRHLYARAPHASFFDYFERTHLNHILAQQNPQSGMFAYMTPLMSGSHRHYSTPFNDFWCCVGTGMESHAKHGESIYWRHANNLYINLYIPSTLEWMAQQTRIAMTTGYPFGEAVEIRFMECRAATALTLWLRVPGWCQGPRLEINGKLQSLQVEHGYIRLTRVWQADDVIVLTLPRSLRLEPTPDDPDTLAMLLGPLVLSADLGPSTQPWHGAAPAFVGEDVLARVTAQGDGTFRADVATQTEALVLSPFTFQHERRNAVYFRRFSQAGWHKEREERAAERLRQAALDARSSDIVDLGNAASEHAHELSSHRSYAVVYRGRTGRDARAGGFMQFMLKTAEGPLVLELTYWGEERDRHFRILVDGHQIAVQRLTGAHPGKFFTCDYPVDPHLTAGRASVTVRIEPFAKRRAGPVFGARLLRLQKAG
ncbi:MAG: glycoside hydrolase family 127 protein, partial [Alphaproteobacteria bacterium]|nr:glycoside hydrolase family 127 protein [Alphaproteobacteria bacterium]